MVFVQCFKQMRKKNLRKKKKISIIHFFNLKKKGFVKGGEILYVWFIKPKITLPKKGSLAFRLQIKSNFYGAQHHLKFFINKRLKIQRNLKLRQASVWNLRAFLGRLIYSRFYKEKNTITLGFKLKKVFLKGIFFLQASNIISCYNVKNSSIRYRRKSLQYIIQRIKKKHHRLYPVRKMHRKKRSR